MKLKLGVAVLLIGLMGGVIGASLVMPRGVANTHKETALERVVRTGTLRCGYNDWQPFFKKTA